MAEINYYADIAMNSSDIQMNKNELQLPVIDNEATAPSSPVEGQMYFDTTAGDKTMYFYNGTAWIEMDGTGSGVTSVDTTDGTFITLSPKPLKQVQLWLQQILMQLEHQIIPNF